MNAPFLSELVVSTPAAVGLAAAALVVLFLAFKATKFVMKLLFLLTAAVVLAGAVWWFFSAHVP